MKKTLFSTENDIIVEALLRMRKDAGYTNQKEFAKTLGISNGSMSRIEQGQRRVDIAELFHICIALELDPVKEAGKIMRKFKKLAKK